MINYRIESIIAIKPKEEPIRMLINTSDVFSLNTFPYI